MNAPTTKPLDLAQFEGHTPGPWKDGPVFGRDGRAIFFNDESKPGKWQRRVDDRRGLFCEDDAKLIAAAPALLAECKRQRAMMERWAIDLASQRAENVRLRAALEAVEARINGDFDNPILMAVGPLQTMSQDVSIIVNAAIKKESHK